MIIEHDEKGEIFHVIHRPAPPGIEEMMRELGKSFIVVPPQYKLEERWEISHDEHGNEVRDRVTNKISLPDPEIDPARHYVSNGDVYERETLGLPAEIKLAVGETVDLKLPDPCQVWVDRETYTVEGGVLTIEGEMDATYNLQINQWPYVPHNIKVTVNASEAH